jgi:hypothetical protein
MDVRKLRTLCKFKWARARNTTHGIQYDFNSQEEDGSEVEHPLGNILSA